MPLSSQQRFLRTNLVQGLVGAARHNVDMGNTGVRLFEVAHVYLPARRGRSKVPRERWHVGGIVDGPFADAKGAVEGIFAALKIEPRFERADVLPLSPVGASVQGGWVAQHAAGTIDGTWSAFELDLEELVEQVPERILYRDVITYPPLREDLAFVVVEARPRGRPDASSARSGRRGAARGAVPQRLPRRADPGRQQVDRPGARLPVARTDAGGRGRAFVCAPRSSGGSPKSSLPSCAPDRPGLPGLPEYEMLPRCRQGPRRSRKVERQRLIASLVERKRLGTQLELIEALAAAGCRVTQATVSRDVRELGIVKTPDPLGRTRYSLPSRAQRVDPRALLETLLAQFGRTAVAAQNVVVVQCEIGSAPAIARALDRVAHPLVVGTLAGDDTCLVISTDARQARSLASELADNLR